VPRDLILLLDTSGSMGGVPLQQLQAFCRGLVAGLAAGDRLEMIEFSSRPHRWRSEPASVDEATRADALRWIGGLRASGGTHMHDAIREALRPLRAEAVRQVVLVTDGLIGFESDIVGHVCNTLPPGCRLHTVGIGSAPNRSLTGPAARAGAGHEAIVGPDEPVEPVVAELLRHTDDPVVVDLTIAGDAVLDRAPLVVADLCAGAPTRVGLRLRASGGSVTLTGRTATGAFSHTVTVGAATGGRRVVATRYARERVEDLEVRVAAGQPRAALDTEIEALGLRHRIATRMTSWVAETAEATVDASAPTRHERIPQALPHAMSAEGVGLRAPMVAMPVTLGRASLAAPAGPPPARRMRKMEKETQDRAPRMQSLDAEEAESLSVAHDALGGAAPADRAVALPRLHARVKLHDRGTLILEIDGPIHWDATGTLWLELEDGSRVQVQAEAATTRPGEVVAGTTARLVVSWSGSLPLTVTLKHLVLEL
jgi:Ca-activated chloride channel family protein